MAADDLTGVIGVIGLGNMGSRMARRLVGAGRQVIGYDVRPVDVPGVGTVEDLASVAEEASILVLSLPHGAIVSEVCRRVLAVSTRSVQVIVDTSTIGPDAAKAMAELCAASGVAYIDAPVSGGIHGAEAGTLSMMIATDQATFDRLDPVLAQIAQRRFLVGDLAGQGQAMKLLNNFLSGTMLATSEAVAFGVREGLDPALIIEVLNVSSGRSSASDDKFPRSVLPGTYDYGFATALMQKDVRLYAEGVRDASESHAVADTVAAAWKTFEEAAPNSDCTAIYEWVRGEYR